MRANAWGGFPWWGVTASVGGSTGGDRSCPLWRLSQGVRPLVAGAGVGGGGRGPRRPQGGGGIVPGRVAPREEGRSVPRVGRRRRRRRSVGPGALRPAPAVGIVAGSPRLHRCAPPPTPPPPALGWGGRRHQPRTGERCCAWTGRLPPPQSRRVCDGAGARDGLVGWRGSVGGEARPHPFVSNDESSLHEGGGGVVLPDPRPRSPRSCVISLLRGRPSLA